MTNWIHQSSIDNTRVSIKSKQADLKLRNKHAVYKSRTIFGFKKKKPRWLLTNLLIRIQWIYSSVFLSNMW